MDDLHRMWMNGTLSDEDAHGIPYTPPREDRAVDKALGKMVSDAERLLDLLEAASGNLEAAMVYESRARQQLKECQKAYDAAIVEQQYTAILDAKQKDGPLAGIAQSTKAFDIALKALEAKWARDAFAPQAGELAAAERSLAGAQVELEQATAAYKGIRAAAELTAQMLRAAST